MKRIIGALVIILCIKLDLNTFALENIVNKENKIKDLCIKSKVKTMDTNKLKVENLKVNAIKQDLLCLLLAYPEFLEGVQQEQNGSVWLITKDGNKIIYDDKKFKSNQQKLENADIQDTMEQIYPINNKGGIMDVNFDPGRARAYNLLNLVYGNSKHKIEKNLGKVNINNHNYQFNMKNGASVALMSVFKQLEKTGNSSYNIRKFIYPCSGTYNYRVISGTNRLSAHSYGIAIDLASNKHDYWKWSTREKGNERIKIYPTEIINAFEDNNFIWGGKWGHFDILHFEYRPEIVLKGRYFGNAINTNQIENWYFGANINDIKTKALIKIIDIEID